MFKKSTKKLQLITLAILILLSSLPVVSASAEISQKVTDQGIYYEINNEEVTITGCAENIKDVVIPQTIEGYPVTTIGDYAFKNGFDELSIETIVIPEGVTRIGSYAFDYCFSLTSITIPSTLKNIGDRGFFECYNIENVYISDLEAWLNIDFEGPFSSPLCWQNNKNLYLNNNLIKDVIIPDGVTQIPSLTFSCTSIESLSIPDSVTTIGEYAFEGCTNLESITVTDNLTSIGNNAFSNTAYYNNPDNWDDNVLYIGSVLVKSNYDDNKYYNYTVKPGTVEIAENAFEYSSWLESIEISDGVKVIRKGAFYECPSLRQISIPESVTTIEDSAFGFCQELSDIYYSGTEAQWNSINISQFENFNILNANIHFESDYPTIFTDPTESETIFTDPTDQITVTTDPVETIESYYVTTYAETIIPTDTTEYSTKVPYELEYEIEGTHAAVIVSYKGYAEDLVIPDYIDGYPVRTISPSVFRDCTTLKSITLPKYLTEIGWYSFENCINLESITIPEGVTELGPCTFNGCTNLKSIVLPDGLKHISWHVFTNCTNLEYIDIPDNLSFLCSDTFTNTPMYNNESNWENDVLYIDSVLIEAKDTINGTYNVKPGTKLIAQDAFNDCKNLKCVTIPFGINRLISRTFYDCTNLERITIPDSVTYIDLEVFYECKNLTDVYYYGTAEEWDSIEIDNSNTCLINADIHFLEFETTIPPTTVPTTPPATEETVPPTTVSSEKITPDGFKYEITNTEAVIVDYLGNETEVIIPKNIDSYPVVGINPHVFEDQVNITAVFIPDTVISIGYCAFKNCTNIKSIVIPESVMYVDVEAFANCVNLKNIIIGDKTKYISASAFVNTAFYNNTDNWEDDVLYLDSVLLKAKESISGAYEIKNDTTRIASGAFRNCTKLESITIPNGIKTIGMGIFSNCTSLKDVIIPESLTGIGDDAFTGCTKLENVYISDIGAWIEMGYGSPDSNPLYYADNLYLNNELVNSLKIPDGVTYITNQAFSCTNLERIEIPESVTQFEIFAFDGCENLTDIYYNGSKEQWNEIFIGEYNESLENITIHFNSTLPTEPSSSVPELNFEIGDVNLDNKLNIKDVTTIQKLLAKLLYFDDIQILLADFNGDKNINVKDATTIQKKIAGFEV